MNASDRAYQEVQARIAEAKRTGARGLDLIGRTRFSALDRLPPELAELTKLETLDLGETKVSDLTHLSGLGALNWLSLDYSEVNDLAPLVSLTSLTYLSFRHAPVSDLRPILGMPSIMDNYNSFHFQDSAATKQDARLAELAPIRDPGRRSADTLEYLRTLPPWPEPYTPKARPDGRSPEPIGGVSEVVQTGQARISHLMQHAMVTRVSAQQFAAQIEEALRGLPATDGNKLPEPLQTMQELAEVLRRLAPEQESADAPLERAALEERIKELEQMVAQLTAQLGDETKAREAAEALAKADGFMARLTKSVGTSVGTMAGVILVLVASEGVLATANHFLGSNHPVVMAFQSALERLPK